MAKSFNTAGPCNPKLHYMVPAEPRLPEARPLIEESQYIVVHAPRQTGKPTTLRALASQLTAEGQHAAVLFSCERSRPAGDDVAAAEVAILSALRDGAGRLGLSSELLPPDPWPAARVGFQLSAALTAWAQQCPRPLVVLIDDIDALGGESLLAVLAQFRVGHMRRPDAFPASMLLCGQTDVSLPAGLAAAGIGADRRATATPFNIVADSLSLPGFCLDDMRELYAQHTTATGQPFTEDALARAWHYTQGQPWLVNALAREASENLRIPPPEPITDEHIHETKNRLVHARDTHLELLADKLHEPQVQRIIEPLVAGRLPYLDDTYLHDVDYVRSLGLIAPGPPVRVANPIYQEVIARTLDAATTGAITADSA